jgi:hypothetical protein
MIPAWGGDWGSLPDFSAGNPALPSHGAASPCTHDLHDLFSNKTIRKTKKNHKHIEGKPDRCPDAQVKS